MKLAFWKRNTDVEIVESEINTIVSKWNAHRVHLGLPIIDEVNGTASTTPRIITSRRVIERIRKTVMRFVSQIFRNTFEEPEWDFDEVNRAIHKESLLRRAIEKYVEQIWKNGFEFIGKNPNTVRYIKRRFRQIAMVSGISTLQLFQQIAFSLVAYANVIIVKKRNERASGGKPYTRFDGKVLKPVAAYFVVSPATIVVDKDEFGNVRKWKQRPQNIFSIKTPEWRPDDVVFIKDNSATDNTYFFAMPMAIPVIPDIKALRETEELALLQAIKFSIPRYHAKIGEKERPAVQEEIDNTAVYLESVPMDAVIVTSSRVKIDNIASGDQVMDLDKYLEYWWNRILAGLGMSRVGFGQGNTANRNTAQVMAQEMQNTTIKFQQIIKDLIENYIIRELLYEGGYTEETLTEENMVYLHIPEIDLESKIRKENHALNLYLSNAITFEEMRNEIGRDVLSEEDINNLFIFKIATKAEQLAAQSDGASAAVQSKDQPENQYGKQSGPPKYAKDTIESFVDFYKELLRETFLSIKKQSV